MAAFDLRNMLADRVDLVNAGAASQQQFCDFLFFVERDGIGGQRQQCGGAAGDQAKHQVVRTGAGGDFGDAPRTFHTALVGHGMAAFMQLNAAQRSDVAVLDVQQAARDAAA